MGCHLGPSNLHGWFSPENSSWFRCPYSSRYCYSQRTQQNWLYMPAVSRSGSTVGISWRLILSFHFGSGVPGVSRNFESVSGVSLGSSGHAVSFAENSRGLDCMAWISDASSTYASSLTRVLPESCLTRFQFHAMFGSRFPRMGRSRQLLISPLCLNPLT